MAGQIGNITIRYISYSPINTVLWDDKEEEEEEENEYEILLDNALDICELVLQKRYWVDRTLTVGCHEGIQEIHKYDVCTTACIG